MTLDGKQIAVVVPAFAEAAHIAVVLDSMPSCIDFILVVDDASPDHTAAVVRASADPRVRLLTHSVNLGVGAAIATGYEAALALGADVAVVMAGDGQMDPADLLAVVAPVVDGRADYVKGNRFLHVRARDMPFLRRAGSAALARWTRTLTGLRVDDTQCGYTAVSARALKSIPLRELWPRYGYPNDLLVMFAARGIRVTEVPVRPVYADETSGLRPWHALIIGFVAARRQVLERKRLGRRPSTSAA